MPLFPACVRDDFPALAAHVHGRPLVYLDNASTTQKPRSVIDASAQAYLREHANIHRGVHAWSVAATDRHEAVREKVARFLGAKDAEEIVFTRGATEALNLVAHSFGKSVLGPGDEVLVSTMEHHSNLVPWQMIARDRGARVRAIPIDDDGQIDLDRFASMMSPRAKIVAVCHVSNALGTVTPVAEITRIAHASGAAVVVDGAQAAPHMRVDVRALGCDFYCFSGHKVFGPTGTGALYGKRERLWAMPPWQGGGDMILSVSFAETTYADPPARFEAGTPNLAGILGLGAAIDYLEAIGLDAIEARERELLGHGTRVLSAIPGLRMIGTAAHKAAILSFTLPGIHPHDAGTILDREGIAVRTGHHCAEPAMHRFGVSGTIRASIALYNTEEEIDRLARGIDTVLRVFA